MARVSPILLRLEAAPRWAIVLLTASLIGAAVLADWSTGTEVALTPAYLLPIALSAWYLPRPALALVTALCAVLWLIVDVTELVRHPALEVVRMSIEFGIYLVFALLLSAMRTQYDRQRELARTDVMTGLRNRRAFWSDGELELERCRRFAQPVAVAYIDVDGFKRVNDRFGHRRGDDLLRVVATTLVDSLRRIDLIARIGGDEFAVLLPGTDATGAATALGKLQERLAIALRDPFGTSCSIGCVVATAAPISIDEVMHRADNLMYSVKSRGRGALRIEEIATDADETVDEPVGYEQADGHGPPSRLG